MSQLTDLEFENLVKEGQEFLKFRNQFRTASNPPAGSPGYLISLAWVSKYKKYCFYDKLARNIAPDRSQTELIQPHPGKITNSDFLEIDSDVYLHGTGQEKGQESEYIDRYIKKTCSERVDYEVISAETWEFVSSRYGFDFEVKRFYNKG